MASVPRGVAPKSPVSDSDVKANDADSGKTEKNVATSDSDLSPGYSRFGVAELTFEAEDDADEVRCRSPSVKRPRRSPSEPPEVKEDLEMVSQIFFTPVGESSASSAMSPPAPISDPQSSSAISRPVPRQVAPVPRAAPPSSSSPLGVSVSERNLVALWTDEEMPMDGALLATVNERLQERCTVVGHWVDTGRNWLWALVRTEAQARQFVKNTNGIPALDKTVTLRSNMSRLSDWPPGTFPFEHVQVVPPSKGKGKGKKGKKGKVPWMPKWVDGKGPKSADMLRPVIPKAKVVQPEIPKAGNVVRDPMPLRTKQRSATPPWRLPESSA